MAARTLSLPQTLSLFCRSSAFSQQLRYEKEEVNKSREDKAKDKVLGFGFYTQKRHSM
jgi:hypothetical protein